MLTRSSCQPLSNAEPKMFVCEICKTVMPAGVPAQKVTLESRAVRYPARWKVYPPAGMSYKAQRLLLRKSPDRTHDDFKKWDSDPGGHGLEIVREGLACSSCVSRLELQSV
jgi:hypothetical protein